jgi:hypothetical protein
MTPGHFGQNRSCQTKGVCILCGASLPEYGQRCSEQVGLTFLCPAVEIRASSGSMNLTSPCQGGVGGRGLFLLVRFCPQHSNAT